MLGYISREALGALHEKIRILVITGLYTERLGECFMERSDLRFKVDYIERFGRCLMDKFKLRLKVKYIERLGNRFINKSELRLKVN